MWEDNQLFEEKKGGIIWHNQGSGKSIVYDHIYAFNYAPHHQSNGAPLYWMRRCA